jgi:S1-C subfamily serine protease
MYADAVARITESIFPIFAIRSDGEECHVEVRGTGFFLDDSGLFLTAEHVVAGAPAGSTLYYYGNIPDEVCDPAVEIQAVASDPAHDLYLGKVCRDGVRPVELCDDPLRPGSSVCLGGYPMPVLSISANGVVGSIRRYWQPTFAIDTTQVVIGERTYDGYIVQHACLVGMSGGPAFDMDGRVRGMAAATISRTVPDPSGSLAVIPNGVVIDFEHIHGFVEAARSQLAIRG